MGNTMIAALCAIGSGVWVWNKFLRRTGGNNQKSIGGAVVVGILVFLTMLIILSQIG